ncbi:nitrite/sulfite reductase [Bordetella hinzii]|uniref:Sulfite reductase n=1 Tax=Bordetella hinzii TaxID=103855 RepID=A0AAN1RVL5_9BORD|nr:nitrite/sulfite reductase [Bordetella hinzii]AKQ53716.1 Sulfite reductase [Bordetella hinzii]AKQ58257.1 Sulfite reductase [Bordetella hinzii]AZW16403.1 sulfite reductase [Bordetella hinzii]KCB33102.1 nitrite/sulfite reductase, 4Fe-4S iron-sulfur cluster-binding domain protein [Bordetella hinzii L60]KCB43577.1 nitrite/sulfite reductase, 4Fe-4S iron-sulfur cluster-binding domain protein [Bordetella hinzii 4161]
MYVYDPVDQQLVEERVAQFAGQTRRFLDGHLSEDEFRVLRLQNGLYIQRHAPMLRVAIPYGMLAARQLRKLAHIARRYDRGYGHFSTRQNIQFNWPRLEDVPAILAELAEVQMHAIQTSGNCIRNTTTDHFAGIAPDELVNPLVWCEIIRQWSTLHPEFAFLPRKFKIAVSGAVEDRAAVGVHDIGLQAVERDGELGFRVWIGGGMGRTPMVGHLIKPFVAWQHLLTYMQAALRIYNLHGRRDNKYKARIKILVKDLTPEVYAQQVEQEWLRIKDGPDTITQEQLDTIAGRFVWPAYEAGAADEPDPSAELASQDKSYARWLRTNVHGHKVPGYAAVTLSLKPTGVPPGDITADQMDAVADLSERYGFGELRVSHEQNLILADVKRSQLPALWNELKALNLATPNIGLLTNIIACPGGDFCALANAVSIPVAEAIQRRFDDLDYLFEIGELDLNISGCINSCGHHHVGHIGILGVDKAGEEWYQVTIGGRQNGAARPLPDIESTRGGGAAVGRIIGPSFAREQVAHVVDRLIRTYLGLRDSEAERFIDVVDRVGIDPFKKDVYADPLLAKPAQRETVEA